MVSAPEVPYKFVEVVWLDAKSDDAWHSPDKEWELPVAVSRGWLVQEDDDKVVLAAGFVGEDGTLHGGPWDIIPAGMVQKLTVLRLEPEDEDLGPEDEES